MKTIFILQGLPASGKSTWARERVEERPGSYKRINKDSIREMLDFGAWSRSNEKMVLRVRDMLIVESLDDGKHVIVDDTNLHPRHLARISQLAKDHESDVRVEIVTFDADVEECIKRDLKRPNSVGEKVIRDMYKNLVQEKEEIAPPVHDSSLPNALIVDIDGTIAKMVSRGPFEWDKVGSDDVNQPVLNVIRAMVAYEYTDARVILVTGRDGVCLPETKEWLSENSIKYDEIYSRPKGDQRKDTEVKQEIYEEHIAGKYNVLCVFDDRNQVVEMWRSLGLTCLQVAEGDF